MEKYSIVLFARFSRDLFETYFSFIWPIKWYITVKLKANTSIFQPQEVYFRYHFNLAILVMVCLLIRLEESCKLALLAE